MKLPPTLFRSVFFSALCFLCSTLEAQTLRGIVRDADDGKVVVGATVALRYSRGQLAPLSIATNPEGEFAFAQIRAGYYAVEVTAQGYDNQTITELNVVSGKELVLDIALLRTVSQLAEVTISAVQPGRRPLLPLGEIPLTRDQTLRYPAMFFDPARLAAAYPGVSQTDDGANSLSIRGNSPTGVAWRLEGVEIVNPNHLPNAGTFSDRPAAASGGVLMFSAQLLDNSSLLNGAMPAGYGNALGGVMDMHLRKGNGRRHEFTAQAGLIGLDLAAEGPMGKNGKNAYLVNYRYSTVGLLGQLGVSFGDEQINFQDLSFHLNFEGKRGSRWSVFGLGGLSENVFRGKADSLEAKVYKDFFDIDFESRTGVIGVSNWTPVGKKSWVKTTIAASGQQNIRSAVSSTYLDGGNADDMNESKLSASITTSERIGTRGQFQTGVVAHRTTFDRIGVTNSLAEEDTREEYYLIQPWLQYSERSKNQKNLLTFGLQNTLLYLPIQSSGREETYSNIEPRFSFTRKLHTKHRISLAAGVYSQVPSLWFLRSRVELLRSRKVELAYVWNFIEDWQFKYAVFRQQILNAPYFINEESSLLNNSEFLFNQPRRSYLVGLGQNQGIEATVERTLADGWFMLANVSLVDSKFSKTSSPEADDWWSTRWDIGHISNLTFGKEWQREKRPGKERTIGLNTRLVWSGGVREAEISSAGNATVVNERFGYNRQYPDYFRMDLRVYWRKNLGNRRNSTFALEFQNLTGRQNLSYHYFDPYTNQIETRYQLGTIPNFSWRVEF